MGLALLAIEAGAVPASAVPVNGFWRLLGGVAGPACVGRWPPGTSDLVPKRMLLDYQKAAFPAYDLEPEDGIPVPCALGQPWVNADTLLTLQKLTIPRTDPWGRPLPGEPDDPIAPRMKSTRNPV